MKKKRNPIPPRLYTAHGKSMTQAAWSRELGISEKTLAGRFRRGLTPEQALVPTLFKPGNNMAKAQAARMAKAHDRKTQICDVVDAVMTVFQGSLEKFKKALQKEMDSDPLGTYRDYISPIMMKQLANMQLAETQPTQIQINIAGPTTPVPDGKTFEIVEE